MRSDLPTAEANAMDRHANDVYEQVAEYITTRLGSNMTLEDLMTALVIPASTFVKGIEIFGTPKYPADEFFMALFEDDYVYYSVNG